MANDIVIRGGTLIDGSGAPGQLADVAISGDRISEIGPGLSGARELDASGQVVAPGFIDIHTHYDAQVFWDPALTPSCYHGVTTVVGGNCGFSIAPTRPEHRETIALTLENVEDMDVSALEVGIPWDFETFPEYLDSIRRRGTILNYNAYVGHTALRLFGMGDAAYERGATDAEIQRMCEALREALLAGAAGLATSFAVTHRGMNGLPIPSRFAEKGEFEALCKVVGEVGKGVVHVAPGDQCNVPDLYPLQRETGVPFTWAALLTFHGVNYRTMAELNTEQRAQGANVWPQVSPRKLTFQFQMSDPFFLNQSDCFANLMSQPRENRLAAYRDPEWRRTAMEQAGKQALTARWENIEVAETTVHGELIGRSVADLASERGASPIDVLCDLSLDENLETRFRQIVANDDDEGVAYLLQREDCVLGLSDGGAHVGQLCDAPNPTTFLGKWVRDHELMPLERAVYKLAKEPAMLFGFKDRGEIRPGMKADVVVFDPDSVDSGPLRRVRDFPANCERLTADQPSGMTHLLVNGTPIRENEKSLHEGMEARPGEVAELA
ncbi:amidohydrolase family protein [Myxococcota bacterium]|nr:amidohydrolase family protein [Myxococcota bacterium]